ncbi:hypothetical protein SAMN02745912_01485 [Paramaledivibacter caminithermalis DSM 15212]|uniref:Uncharacterized protein n=1 Tax=Paramaledivibacter caminithermalis (strain DSM 15212 / CIP 107654 / DViRD3) TaxID=1121301 RepID=A0A1M6MYC6_PARC5|nr:YeeE/YedE thiosulfate transporter family protein [Paramaledivibacter caminithermalis]SHJ88455.1 hypothetical protein SAMN02745912_01485 [Paramaledivibacter caminithermalis DSM 15212]
MSSSKIQELKKNRQLNYKGKKNQLKYGLIFIMIVSFIYLYLFRNNFIYSIIWLLGLFIGFTLQKSRFCFTASFRDPIMVGSTSIFKAVIIAFIISTVGFAIIQYKSLGGNIDTDIMKIPGQIAPVGVHTALGAILFGIGMVIAGGCASGTLMRIGEGFILQLIVLIGFVIGTLLGARHFEFWDKLFISKSPAIYIPHYLGFPLSITIQILVLIILYYIADWYDKNNNMMAM